MKFFAVIPALLSAVAGQGHLYHEAGLYHGAGPLPVSAAVDARFAYGAPITALNALPAAAPAPAVASYAAIPAQVAAPVVAAPAVAPYAAIPAQVAAPVVAAPAVAPYAAIPAAPVAGAVSSQYQAQDEFGNIAYGYQNVNSAKQESGNALGGVTGSYTYQDEAGVHTVNYVADQLGFRVSGDNLPVGPSNFAVAPVHDAEPVVDTPEVIETKAAFFKAYNAAKSGVVKRSAQIPLNYANLPAAGLSLNYAAGLPLNYAAAPVAAPLVAAPAIAAPVAYNAAPVAYAGAPAREAVLTTIKLNPGHAVAYRVD